MSEQQLRLWLLGAIAAGVIALNVQILVTFQFRGRLPVDAPYYGPTETTSLTVQDIRQALDGCELSPPYRGSGMPDKIEEAYSLKISCPAQ